MKCPLLSIGYLANPKTVTEEDTDCLKKECAWWDAPVERCLMLNISENASLIYLELNEIRGKMPHKK